MAEAGFRYVGLLVKIFVSNQPLPAQRGQWLVEPALPEPLHEGQGLDGCRTKTFPLPLQQ